MFSSVFSKFRYHFYLTVGAVCYKCFYHPPHEEADRYKPNPWLLSLPGQAWSKHPSFWYNDGSKSLLSLRPASRASEYNTRTDYLMLLDLGLCLVLLLWARPTHSNISWPAMVGCDIRGRTQDQLPFLPRSGSWSGVTLCRGILCHITEPCEGFRW